MGLSIKFGDVIPVRVQLSDGATGMFPKTLIYDADNTLLATKNLSHITAGLYGDSNNTTMPNTDFVQLKHSVYTTSGYTTISSDYELAVEIYNQEVLNVQSTADIEVTIEDSPSIDVTIE